MHYTHNTDDTGVFVWVWLNELMKYKTLLRIKIQYMLLYAKLYFARIQVLLQPCSLASYYLFRSRLQTLLKITSWLGYRSSDNDLGIEVLTRASLKFYGFTICSRQKGSLAWTLKFKYLSSTVLWPYRFTKPDTYQHVTH